MQHEKDERPSEGEENLHASYHPIDAVVREPHVRTHHDPALAQVVRVHGREQIERWLAGGDL